MLNNLIGSGDHAEFRVIASTVVANAFSTLPHRETPSGVNALQIGKMLGPPGLGVRADGAKMVQETSWGLAARVPIEETRGPALQEALQEAIRLALSTYDDAVRARFASRMVDAAGAPRRLGGRRRR